MLMPDAYTVGASVTLAGTIQSSSNLSASVSSSENLYGSVQITRRIDDHRLLIHRDASDQHPISAITSLTEELSNKVETDDAMSNIDIDNILRRFI